MGEKWVQNYSSETGLMTHSISHLKMKPPLIPGSSPPTFQGLHFQLPQLVNFSAEVFFPHIELNDSDPVQDLIHHLQHIIFIYCYTYKKK